MIEPATAQMSSAATGGKGNDPATDIVPARLDQARDMGRGDTLIACSLTVRASNAVS